MMIEREAAALARETSAPKPSSPQNVKAGATAENAQASSSATTQGAKVSATHQPQPEESFQQGMAALRQGNPVLAIRLLGEAARLEPKQPRYRAHYGRALASNPQMRRQAEAEFQAAITLDARNVSYRVMLAEFYRDIGFQRRAQGELERALSVDPNHSAALQMLESIRQKG
jgi:cytochrome c-type biogenesis protein CcmH/NrfG